MKKSLIIFIYIFSSLAVFADNGELFKKGNLSYQEGKFEEAINYYEQILNSGSHSSALFYNLGNSYYKIGDLAKAILNYEKALRLSPSDEKIRYNLNIANLQITDRKADFSEKGIMGLINKISRMFSADGWAWLSIFFFLLIFFLFLFIYISKTRWIKRVYFGATFVFLFLGMISILFAQKNYADFNQTEAIIMNDQQGIMSEPKSDAVVLFILNSGSKVEILTRKDDWIEVKYDSEKIGWVNNSFVEEIKL